MIRRTACLIARGNEPCRNLAIEKHLMDTLPENTAILYLCQNRHAIVVGRSQNPWHECKVESFLESGGVLTRRLSGGGASYQDMGSLSFSLILPKTDYDIARQFQLIISAIAGLRIHSEIGVGNTLQAGGRSYCENAFYKAGSAAIHHGVILVDTAMDVREHYLKARIRQPDVRERYAPRPAAINLRELNPDVTVDTVEQQLCYAFAAAYRTDPAWLDERIMDSGSLRTLTAQFEDTKWVYPEAVNYDFTVSERFPWGSVTVLLLRENGIIRSARIFSDAMEAGLFLRIEQGLIGCPFLIGAINTRFEQRLALLRDPRLLRIAGDVCKLICGRIRAMDREQG